MKTTATLLCVIAATLQFAPAAHGQEQGRRMPPGARWQMLSDGERAKLRAAHQQALQEAQVRAAHERLIQARREFRDVMQPAMVRADPSVQPILEKLRANRRQR
jgi:phosphoglycolate phosphatase-like HAD superfamily hydrolase